MNLSPGKYVTVAVIISWVGFTASLYAQDLGIWRLPLVILAIPGSAFLVYARVYRPLLELDAKHAKTVAEILLSVLLSEYKKARDGNYVLRANVWVAIGRHKGNRVLRPVAHAEGFSEAEKELEFEEDIGAVGTALKLNEPVIYDAQSQQQAEKGMSATQLKVTEHVGAVLAVPLYGPGDEDRESPVGVLSVDT